MIRFLPPNLESFPSSFVIALFPTVHFDTCNKVWRLFTPNQRSLAGSGALAVLRCHVRLRTMICSSSNPNSSIYIFRIGFLSDEITDDSPYRVLAFFFIMLVEIGFVVLGWLAVINERRMWLYVWYGLSTVQLIVIGFTMGFLAKVPDLLHTTNTQFFVVGAANAVTHLGTVVCVYLYSRAFGVGMPEVFQLRVETEDDEVDNTESSEDDADSITAGSFSHDFS